MTRYRCKKCKVEADINKEKREMKVTLPPEFTKGGFSFPSHVDCEFMKKLSEIDLEKLERIG